jgi:hypothetical protein
MSATRFGESIYAGLLALVATRHSKIEDVVKKHKGTTAIDLTMDGSQDGSEDQSLRKRSSDFLKKYAALCYERKSI